MKFTGKNKMNKKSNRAILLLGSNIEPKFNIQKALELLSRFATIEKQSNIWETEAIGSTGPNFLNMAVEIETSLDDSQIKTDFINPIETKLKRIRTSDKYAPRTIDIDIIFFNEDLIELNIWDKLFIALPVSEINPNIKNINTGETILAIVEKLKSSAKAELFSG